MVGGVWDNLPLKVMMLDFIRSIRGQEMANMIT